LLSQPAEQLLKERVMTDPYFESVGASFEGGKWVVSVRVRSPMQYRTIDSDGKDTLDEAYEDVVQQVRLELKKAIQSTLERTEDLVKVNSVLKSLDCDDKAFQENLDRLEKIKETLQNESD
jgi:enamine deaminase RidA (YjgF/YER057c/UK114 family)